MDPSSSVATAVRSDFLTEFADAYRSIALRKADMLKATYALEAVRSALADRRTGLRALDALDDQIGLAESAAVREALIELRRHVFERLSAEELARLEALAERNREAAERDWLETYAAALWYWRLDLCQALVRSDLAPPSFAGWTEAMLREDWTPAQELFRQLGENEALAAEQRASFLVYAAQVELYHMLRLEDAHELLERAAVLAPEAATVITGFGEYWLEQGDTAKAKEHFLRGLERDPRSDAAKLMGDALDKEQATDEAERWYLDAIARAPGSPSRYLALVSLYARPEGHTLFETRAQPLIERALAVDPLSVYSACVSVGECFQRLGETNDAFEWWKRAIDDDSTRPQAYVSKGYSFVGRGELEQAEKCFGRAIKVAPTWVEAYWGLASVREKQERWDDALERYETVVSLRPAWEPQARARMAAVHRLGGDWDKAEETLMGTLRDKPHDGSVLAELHTLATAIQDERGETDRALDLLRSAREIEGESYEANFQNRVGNVYYSAGRYAEAADAYRASIADGPDDAVVRRNLAGACRLIGLFDEGKEQLDEGLRLDGDRSAYDYGLAMLRNEQAHVLYGEARYGESLPLYEEATQLQPQDAVLHSNLANAWWSHWVPGVYAANLANARSALERAIELDPQNTEYDARLAQVRFEQRLLEALGEPEGFELGSMPRTIALELAPDLLDLILVEGTEDLNPETLAAVAAFRARYRERTDLAPSGVRFASNEFLPPGFYQLYLLEHAVAMGFLNRDSVGANGSPPIEVALGQLEHELDAAFGREPAEAEG